MADSSQKFLESIQKGYTPLSMWGERKRKLNKSSVFRIPAEQLEKEIKMDQEMIRPPRRK